MIFFILNIFQYIILLKSQMKRTFIFQKKSYFFLRFNRKKK